MDLVWESLFANGGIAVAESAIRPKNRQQCKRIMLAVPGRRPHDACVNSKHRKTLAAVFREPASGTIAWVDLESLLVAAGCEKIEGSGSRVRFARDGEIETFHRPHPAKEAKRYQVAAARGFLIRLGVRP